MSSIPVTLIFYESPHRILDTLNDMLNILGDRKVCLCRELTKLHEEFIRGTLSELITLDESTLRGEMVLVVEGASNINKSYSEEELIKLVNEELKDGISLKQACQEVSKMTGEKKNKLYQLMINQK